MASITTITTTKITTRTAFFAGLDLMDASLLYQRAFKNAHR